MSPEKKFTEKVKHIFHPHHHGHSYSVAQLLKDQKDRCLVTCKPSTQLFNTTQRDRGWACGYRNCQMLLSSLHILNSVPSVGELQRMLELAWQAGYDPDGATQLGHRVQNTRTWIGATEIYCILAHLGVVGNIVDFHRPTDMQGGHPALISWIIDYFISDDKGQQHKHPLYLQHQGHSRMVVGVDMSEEKHTWVLCFDPDVENGCLRLSANEGLRERQYQVVYVSEYKDEEVCAVASPPKIITSTRIP